VDHVWTWGRAWASARDGRKRSPTRQEGRRISAMTTLSAITVLSSLKRAKMCSLVLKRQALTISSSEQSVRIISVHVVD